MATTTTNMLLKVWNTLGDFFSHSDLQSNWNAIDAHDHSTGKGAQIGATGLTAALAQSAGVNQTGQASKGLSVNAGPGTRTGTTFGALGDAADQVANIVLPTNGLIAAWYQATWQESVSGAARATIFLGPTEVQAGYPMAASPSTATEASIGIPGVTARNVVLSSYPLGLASYQSVSSSLQPTPPATYTGDVTTGQVVGGGLTFSNSAGAGANSPQFIIGAGGPCYIFAAAGTYTVSVQFKASSGTVTASNRKLWVRSFSFG